MTKGPGNEDAMGRNHERTFPLFVQLVSASSVVLFIWFIGNMLNEIMVFQWQKSAQKKTFSASCSPCCVGIWKAMTIIQASENKTFSAFCSFHGCMASFQGVHNLRIDVRLPSGSRKTAHY